MQILIGNLDEAWKRKNEVRAIQIIRDILGGRQYVTQTFFFATWNTAMVFGSKKLCLKARLGVTTRYFLTCLFQISKHAYKSSKQAFKKVKYHKGCQKSNKKVSRIIWITTKWRKEWEKGTLISITLKLSQFANRRKNCKMQQKNSDFCWINALESELDWQKLICALTMIFVCL